MPSKKKIELVIAVIICVFLFMMGVSILDRYYVNGVMGFAGQSALSKDNSEIQKSYLQETEYDLLLGHVSPSMVKKVIFFRLPEDLLFWTHYYPGLPQTELDKTEISAVLEDLRDTQWFTNSAKAPQTEDEEMASLSVSQEQRNKIKTQLQSVKDSNIANFAFPGLRQMNSKRDKVCKYIRPWFSKPKAIRKEIVDSFYETKFAAQRGTANDRRSRRHPIGDIGVVQFFLKDGRMGEIRVFWSNGKVAIIIKEQHSMGLIGISEKLFPLIVSLSQRSAIEPIAIEFPQLNSSLVNLIAELRLGSAYRDAFNFVKNSGTVQTVLGSVVDIRPAKGLNRFGSWMDSQSADITLKVSGTKGDGVLMVRGYKTFDGELIFKENVYSLGRN
jgi:hypothetical protein